MFELKGNKNDGNDNCAISNINHTLIHKVSLMSQILGKYLLHPFGKRVMN